jgi:hypothetical protein
MAAPLLWSRRDLRIPRPPRAARPVAGSQRGARAQRRAIVCGSENVTTRPRSFVRAW